MNKLTHSQMIGTKLKRCRQSMGYSQGDLGELLNIAQNTVCKYETEGITNIDTIYDISFKLGINLLSDIQEDAELKSIIVKKIYEIYDHSGRYLLTKDYLQNNKLFSYGKDSKELEFILLSLEKDNMIRLYESDEEIYILMTAKGILKMENKKTLFSTELIAERLSEKDIQELIHPQEDEELNKEGLNYGTNVLTNNPIFIDRKSLNNPSCLILGPTGSGKSLFIQKEISNVIKNTDDQVSVISLFDEYKDLAQQLDGEIININVNQDMFINPLDLYIKKDMYDRLDVCIAEKTNFLITFCNAVLKQEITDTQKSILARCVKKIYEPYIAHMEELLKMNQEVMCDTDASPTLIDFYDMLIEQPEYEAHSLAISIERFCIGQYNMFSYKSSMKSTKKFKVYNLDGLEDDLKEIGTIMCLEDIRNSMIENSANNGYTWLYVEISYPIITREILLFLKNMKKNSRKMNALFTTSISSVKNLTDSVMHLTSMDIYSILNEYEFFVILMADEKLKSEVYETLNIKIDIVDYGVNRNKKDYLYLSQHLIPFDFHC